MEQGLKDIKFNVQKHIEHRAMSYNPALVRDKPPGEPAYCETRLLKKGNNH